MRFTKYSSLFLLVLGLMAIVSSCRDDKTTDSGVKLTKDYDATVSLKWNNLFLEIERYAAGYRPGPAPRALAYMGISAYESVVAGMPDYNSIKNLYQGLDIPNVESGKEYHWPSCVNASYGFLFKKFFPNASADLLTKIDLLQAQLETDFASEASADVIARSKAYGEAVANAVWEWEKTDTYGHDAYKDPFGTYDWQAAYNNTDGKWLPTTPGPGKPMYPNWGKVRTFAIKDADKISRPPFPYSEDPHSKFYAQALECYSSTVPQTYEGQWIAEFWSDDLVNLTFSPGPRWAAVANQVIAQENSTLETAVYTYAKLGMALSDAAVACWNSKYIYNVERPVSYINRIIDPNWKPTLSNPLTGDTGVTPSFPAYPSGHSTMGGAGAEVLTDVFGIDYAMTDRCHEGRTEFNGTPRAFSSFYEMAYENAYSRVPLGVHFRMDCDEGVRLGFVCGQRVNNLPFKK